MLQYISHFLRSACLALKKKKITKFLFQFYSIFFFFSSFNRYLICLRDMKNLRNVPRVTCSHERHKVSLIISNLRVRVFTFVKPQDDPIE